MISFSIAHKQTTTGFIRRTTTTARGLLLGKELRDMRVSGAIVVGESAYNQCVYNNQWLLP